MDSWDLKDNVMVQVAHFKSIKLSIKLLMVLSGWLNIYTEGKSLAKYFGDSQFKRNRTFNSIVSKIYVDKRSRVQ